jgi:hypothetical protein
MLSPLMFIVLVTIAAAVVIGIMYYKKQQYNNAVNCKFPSNYIVLLEKRLPVYQYLPEELKQQLHRQILRFLYTKTFIGCNGLIITDEIRVVIAAEACLLILNRPNSGYAGLKWIYVYPSVFVAKQAQKNEYGLVSQQKRHLLGESWQNGKVILAWDSVESGMSNFHDGNNVVLHEFAHQLDQESGQANGAPLLYTRDSYRIWSQVFSKEFNTLQQTLAVGQSSIIDGYAATNPAEFFAVITELFFERPVALQQKHPQLFELLEDYYQLDPRDWLP